MAYIARDKNNDLYVYDLMPVRNYYYDKWMIPDILGNIFNFNKVKLPSNSDEKLIGKHITWEDEAVELK